MRRSTPLLLALAALAASAGSVRSDEVARPAVDRAIADGISALGSTQAPDGHWGSQYPVAVTSMAGLAILAGKEKPLADPAVLRAWSWLRARQKDGDFRPSQWVHEQGFATLFCAELYGKTLQAKTPPKEIDKDELKEILTKAVALLADAQSKSGGWYYTKAPDQDEGSTTVCAVQAIRSAKNFGISVEPHVLERGFAYLKAMQNQDGGFRYAGQSGGSMNAGTAAAVATLVLMSKLDERVLLSGVKFLEQRGAAGIARAGQGQYGLFYSAMAMKVIAEEYGDHLPVAGKWTREAEEQLLQLRQDDGTWRSTDVADPGYGTALAVLSLACPRGELSIFHRRAPKLP
jgi:hypothetical protein